jgi:DNA-binding NarL/FixJ family response regulator
MLVLSEKTVERHLAHIFAKLEVSSRTGAARLAVQAGIA